MIGPIGRAMGRREAADLRADRHPPRDGGGRLLERMVSWPQMSCLKARITEGRACRGASMSALGLAVIGVVGYVGAVYLLYQGGWNGEDYLVCRACGYDLRGVTRKGKTREARCPECGGVLAEETVERASTRKARRYPKEWVGVALLVVSCALLCISAMSALAPWL